MKQRSAEILCIGTELLMGDIINTNAAYLAKELAGLGINLYHQSVVGDNPERLRQSLQLALKRADIVITTGGLGPTYDDLSKETIAACFGRTLVMDEDSLTRIQAHFLRLGREMTDNNKKQAMMPQGCVIFQNENGTAPGCAIEGSGELEGKTAIMLPGPPREMKPMFEQQVKPYLLKDSDTRLVSHTMHFFGIGESMLEDRLRSLMEKSLNPTVAPYAKTGEVMLRLTAKGDSPAACEERMAPLLEQVRGRLGAYLYGIDVSGLEETVLHLLHQHGKTFSAAESCTGGLIAKRITDLPGASCVFRGGVVSYTNEVKASVLGVPQETLDRYGAVSEPVARAMAEGVRRITGSDLSVATTGLAGPDGDDRGNPVGTVFVALSTPERTVVRHMNCGSGRDRVRMLASHCAFDLLRRELEHLPIEGE